MNLFNIGSQKAKNIINITPEDMEILAHKGEKSEIKRKLDALNVGETFYDPNTGIRYECIGKFPNGESLTVARSRNVETI